ncbi:MAG: ORF6N domain-containing protein [Candidatus Omnitrophota bacterium]|nr:ORF6N domain-containing protein [Candidatus Omnitrophota bacterium]
MQKRGVKKNSVAVEIIQSKICLVRGHKVMLDKDLAEMYGVSTRRLKEQVRRNLKRFPEDFMFELTWDEAMFSRSQFATLNQGRNIKYLPYAFTEQGVAMLSSVLNSDRAIEVNIQIMRVFVRLKELIMSRKDLARKIVDLERKFGEHDAKIIHIFDAIRQLMAVPDRRDGYKRTKIGFIVDRSTPA